MTRRDAEPSTVETDGWRRNARDRRWWRRLVTRNAGGQHQCRQSRQQIVRTSHGARPIAIAWKPKASDVSVCSAGVLQHYSGRPPPVSSRRSGPKVVLTNAACKTDHQSCCGGEARIGKATGLYESVMSGMQEPFSARDDESPAGPVCSNLVERLPVMHRTRSAVVRGCGSGNVVWRGSRDQLRDQHGRQSGGGEVRVVRVMDERIPGSSAGNSGAGTGAENALQSSGSRR